MRSGLLIALAIPFLAVPGLAAAQADTCVVLPSPSSQAPLEAREQVQAVVTEQLREHGNIVLSPRDAQLRMAGQPMQDCAAIDCAAGVNRYLGTGFAVLTEIAWAGGRITMINVALIGLEDGESVGGQAEVIAGDVGAAVRAAFQAAWDRWATSQQGYVVVTTTPPGAFVELDGQSLGRSPIRRLSRAGVHTLHVTLEGYRSVTREITVDRHEEREITIALREGEGEDVVRGDRGHVVVPPHRTETREEAHWANYLIGGGLIAVGALALITPFWTLAEEGSPVSGTDDMDYVSFGPVSGVLLGLGAAAIIGGTIMMIVGPIRTTVTVSPSTASLTLSGSF